LKGRDVARSHGRSRGTVGCDANRSDSRNHEGRHAKAFTTKRLLAAKTVVVKTIRVDLHGRYVAHLIYSDRDVSIDTCFKEGTHLNNELVVDGYAGVVAG